MCPVLASAFGFVCSSSLLLPSRSECFAMPHLQSVLSAFFQGRLAERNFFRCPQLRVWQFHLGAGRIVLLAIQFVVWQFLSFSTGDVSSSASLVSDESIAVFWAAFSFLILATWNFIAFYLSVCICMPAYVCMLSVCVNIQCTCGSLRTICRNFPFYLWVPGMTSPTEPSLCTWTM